MEFNKENIMGRVNPALFSISGIKAVKLINEINITHNHYQLAVEFTETQFWKDTMVECGGESPGTWVEIRPQLFEANTKILESTSKTLDESELYNILKVLVYHSCASHNSLKYRESNLFRFHDNSWNNPEVPLQHIEYALNLCNQINSYTLDPETTGVSGEKSWNREIMGSIWACVYGGLIEEGLYIIQTIEDLIFKIHSQSGLPTNCVFPTVLDQSTPGRFLKSLRMPKARLYMSNGELKKAEATFKSIVDLCMFTNDSKYRVYWDNGLNRITEAAIEVYNLNPTQENKDRCLDFYYKSTNTTIEPTEAVRERCLITYMLMRDVLNIKFK